MPGHGANPLEHVLDHHELEIPWVTPPRFELKIPLPQIFGLQITRFMVMELVAAVLVIVVMVPVVRHISRNYVSRGRFANMIEAMLLFIRDDVARPAIGGHAADRFLPYLWTVFFFVLFSNLLGMIPGGASPTGNINVTAVLALMTLATVLMAGVKELGFVGYWVGIVPHLDVPASAQAVSLGADVLYRSGGALDPAHRARGPALRQHVRRPRGAGRDPRLHSDGLQQLVDTRTGRAGEYRGRDLPESARTVCRIFTGVYFYFPLSAFHRHGGSSALSVTA